MKPQITSVDRLHGDEGLDIEPYLAAALSDVLDTVMLYGKYPAKGRAIFDLREWITEHVDNGDLVNFYATQLMWVNAEYLLEDEASRLEKMLREHFLGSELVAARAEELAEEEE